ncbi:MAG: RES family NAD+ phosphorylase [Gemmatimonadetes bacterium]|nr:RES family NAD+ phosphorylase [Gemmatimonadota bacterium]
MRVWRITRRRYRGLDDEGARAAGGRWNSEGLAVVYTSASLSLAALEYLVHVDIEDVPDDLIAMAVEVPDDASVEEVSAAALPKDWNRVPDHAACIEIGDRWAARRESLVLRVPSAVVPEESNLLLNPQHPRTAEVRTVSTRDFAFDPRLL